jgi:hypothetical protein
MAHRTLQPSRVFLIGATLWAGRAFLIAWLLKSVPLEGAAPYLLAIASVVPSGLMLHGMLGMIRAQDELYRRIQFEAIAFAASVIWLVTLTWGLLEVLDLVAPLPGFWIASAMVFFYGFGGWFFGRRYQ